MFTNLAFSIAASSIGFVAGGLFLKKYADTGALSQLGIAFTIFGVSNLIYAQVLAKGLGQGSVLTGMAHLIMMSAAGVLFFGEKMGPYHVAGLVSALATIWMFTLANHAP